MRKVTEETVTAFLARKPKSIGNTCSTGDELRLHGNTIAYWESENGIILKMAGWGTATTRERLNGVLELAQGICYDIPVVRLCQRKGEQVVWTMQESYEFDSSRNCLAVSMRSGAVELLGTNSEGTSPRTLLAEPSV